MNIIKKVTIITLIFMTVLYFPLVAKATENERIISEAQKYLQYSTPIEINDNLRVVNKPYTKVITRAANMSIRRSSTSDGISLVITQDSGRQVDVCIFNSDATEVIGHTQNVQSGQLSTLNWTASELGNERDVLVFMTCYKDITYTVWGSIVY